MPGVGKPGGELGGDVSSLGLGLSNRPEFFGVVKIIGPVLVGGGVLAIAGSVAVGAAGAVEGRVDGVDMGGVAGA